MDFEYQTLNFPADYDGAVVATLIKAPFPVQDMGRAVLYVHGYVDYFFQEHMAEEFVARGYRFYAVELRKYGRSYLEGQHPDFARSMSEYYPDLTESIGRIMADGASEIILLGHSTGGLLAALYADDGPVAQRGAVRCVVLNSPFLEFNTTWFKKHIQIPLAALASIVFPFAHKKNELSPLYAKSVHKDYCGHWHFDTAMKPIEGIPLYFSWLRAVLNGQRRAKRGLHIAVPVLVMSSDKSFFGKEWSDELFRSDSVLNVEDIRRYASSLGPDVTYVQIKGGIHDLFLSTRKVRAEAFRIMFEWLAGIVGSHGNGGALRGGCGRAELL